MTKARPNHDANDTPCYGAGVPRPPKLKGNPDDIVPLQVRMPLWMKRGVLDVAKARGQDLSELTRELYRELLKAEGKPSTGDKP